MRSNKSKKYALTTSAMMAGLMLTAGSVFAASTTVNLTAERMSVTLPDGNAVPMWGFCDAGTNTDATALAGATLTGASTCTNVSGWMPGPMITIPYDAAGTALTINLTNNLPTPTSIVILGQLGGGLGTPGRQASPTHSPQNVTWPAGDATTFFYPPAQKDRARSFSPETANATTSAYTWANLKPGTYIYETGSHPSIQAPMGLYGLLVVTNAPVAATSATAAISGTAYPNINYDAEAALLFSEIDPKQNTTVDQAALFSGGCTADLTVACTGTINEAMYPPAVNYTPIYFLVNGHSFDPTSLTSNVLPVAGDALTGKVMLRLANAGLHSHVPTTTGLPMAVVAEDGNVQPGNPKVKTQLLLPAGKTNDVLVSPPVTGTAYTPNAYGIFDRELATSANKQSGGMQAVLQVAGGALPTALVCQANNDDFAASFNSTFFSGNVLSNDRGLSAIVVTANPTNGTVTLNSNGSFIYTPNNGATVTTDTFTYQGHCIGDGKDYPATVKISAVASGVPTANADIYTSKVATLLKVNLPGVLSNDIDTLNYKLTAALDVVPAGLTVILQPDGSFSAQTNPAPTAATSYTFTYHVVNAQGVASAPANVTLNFTPGSGLQVAVLDTQDKSAIPDNDYSWVIEEDNTWFADPTNPSGTGTSAGVVTPPQSVSTNFHKSFMPVVAAGCTGPRSCGDANTQDGGLPVVPAVRSLPADVVLDPAKRYFISVLPGDSIDGDPDSIGTATPVYGHAMGGSTIAPGKLAVTVLAPRNPLPGGQISVIVFEDSGPTNGGVDDGEPGLGGFTINLFDTRGSTGDIAGQTTYDLAGMPLTNALAGTIATDGSGANLCPLPTPMGVITTCPELDDQGNPSPLAGMALIKNVEPGRYDVLAIPGIERANKGEAWVQVSTLEGTPVNDTFVKPGEPGYWQEFGSPGFHSFIGFINPEHVKAKQAADAAVDPAIKWTNMITGNISSLHMDRPPAANLNDSCATAGSVDETCRAALSHTQCQVSINLNGTAENISYAMCDNLGNFTLTGVPPGNHELVIWDQWLDQIIAYKAVNVPAGSDAQTIAMGSIPVFNWFTRIQQTAFIDNNGNGIQDADDAGIPMIPLNVRFRDGSISNYLGTDLAGNGGTNELFPLFNWYVLETDTTRYKGTKVHVVYDAGGKPDLTGPYAGVLNSTETTSLPSGLQYPGSTYVGGKTERFDPGSVVAEGIQGFVNQTAVVDWGKQPYATGENGGLTGMVYYASTRALDDPQLEGQLPWEPGVANVKINLYTKTINADGSESLALIDTTTTSSWDANVNNMHCPGDAVTDPFVTSTLGAADQFKCYDGQHVFNQIQPAVYDGRYRFPSDSTKPQLAPGKYVVEVVLPEGYEIVKEEDNNVFNGDSWMNPDTATQFAGVGNVFILKDQATLNNPYTLGSGAAFPPCVGRLHRVPDYLSMFPELQNVSPYAGEDRPLCDRKEVVLDDQSQGGADFQVFTPTMVAAHFTGIMLNDAAAEFDPYSPSFGEKAALPNAPIAIRDYNGIEIGRVYNDKYGSFNGMTVSTYDANVPNPSGYAPNMLTWCMNDPGPIADPSGAVDANGKPKMIIDPMYNPMFSNFCYAWPTLPGQTSYLDTPVLPTAAYANASSYQPVDCQYPDATPAIARVDSSNGTGPWVREGGGNTITIQALGDVSVLNPAYAGPTALNAPANQPKITRHYGFGSATGRVSVNGITLTVTSWSDTSITATVPATVTTGELEITADNGNKSIDAVTLHVISSGDPAPTVVNPVDTAVADGLAHPIQDAIDAANPGDLIILEAGSYPELVVMYKPVQLQGVGASSVVINATKYPNQKLRQWRTLINTKFGLDDQGNVIPGNPPVDPLPGQEITGGILKLEPSVLASEEGAGITVLAKEFRSNGTTHLNGNENGDCRATLPNGNANPNYSANNFKCAASLIDGVTVTGGDAGGGIYVNGWAHGLEIANNRVYGNAGPFNGGVRVGQPYLEGQTLPNLNAANSLNGAGLAYDVNVNIHNNSISTNGMVEGAPGAVNAANSGGAGGGLSICAGSDNYKVTGNWICGNYSSADGGGIGHLGHSRNGNISKNFILFNESYNQTGTQNGGGIAIEGELISNLGTGNVTVDSNLIQGNFARAGQGGGVRLQDINGAEVNATRPQARWWRVNMINNMIVNNVAGWAGGGVSMYNTLNSHLVNNTIASNDSMGMTGNLFNTIVNGVSTGPTAGVPGPAGISSETTSAALAAATGVADTTYGISNPLLRNNIVWQNRSFFFDMRPDANGVPAATMIASNNWNDAVAHTGSALVSQTATGECVSGAAYWDMGVVGNTSPTALSADANLNLTPRFDVLTAIIPGYPTQGNTAADPKLVHQYCNGSRVLPGLQFEPGTPFQPNFQIAAAATLDESGNFVDLHFGPISLTDPGNTTAVVYNGNYHLLDSTSSAADAGRPASAPAYDYDGDPRPQGAQYDIGADELAGAAVLSPATLVFPSTLVGTTSAPLTATLTNSGLLPVTLIATNAITISGTNPGDFAIAPGGTCIDGLVLAVGTNCTINVTFTPTARFNRVATLSVTDSVGTQSIGLQGVGAAPVVSLSAVSIAFGTIANNTTAFRVETVTNIGNAPLTITSAVVTNNAPATTQFAIATDTCSGAIVPVGGTCSVTVTFTPTTVATRSGTLTFTDNALNSPQTVALSGR